MLVTVGSGVSVMKVNSPTDFERVGGTALGGGSFWGLCKLLTNIGDFDELMEIIKGGDPTKTDLLVGDIYGGNYDAIGLNATTTASLFAVPFIYLLAKHVSFIFHSFSCLCHPLLQLWQVAAHQGGGLQVCNPFPSNFSTNTQVHFFFQNLLFSPEQTQTV